MPAKKTRVVAAMSGGVDSAVAAALLVEAGYDVVGVTMKMYSPTKPAHAKSCCGADDFDDARRSASVLGIPHYVLDFEETFRVNVIDRFARDYATGRTPNPCVACNNFVKLGTLQRYARQIGATFVATGHYARVAHERDGAHLYRGTAAKDQAYALAQLSRQQLATLLLPLGGQTKGQTRAQAAQFALPIAEKSESQDICFVEGGDYRDVLERIAPQTANAGEIQSTRGERIGVHAGIGQFTVGQRRGLPASTLGPRYVTRIDASTNTIVIGGAEELEVRSLVADEVNVIRPNRFSNGAIAVAAMTRYRSQLCAARATVRADGTLALAFDAPQRAVTPGQLVALFDPATDEVLGAATIRETSI